MGYGLGLGEAVGDEEDVFGFAAFVELFVGFGLVHHPDYGTGGEDEQVQGDDILQEQSGVDGSDFASPGGAVDLGLQLFEKRIHLFGRLRLDVSEKLWVLLHLLELEPQVVRVVPHEVEVLPDGGGELFGEAPVRFVPGHQDGLAQQVDLPKHHEFEKVFFRLKVVVQQRVAHSGPFGDGDGPRPRVSVQDELLLCRIQDFLLLIITLAVRHLSLIWA